VVAHERSQKWPVHCDGAFPRRSLAGVEVETHGHELERSQVAAREVADRKLEYGGAHELGDAVSGCTVRWRCREPEALGSRTQVQRLVAKTGTEVVHLVDDQQVESVPEPLDVAPTTLEGGDRDRLEAALAVS
jgi:hypothetical protein